MITLPAGVVPIRDLTTREVLYGSRESSVRYELLAHDPATGVDSLIGRLDGVKPASYLTWQGRAQIKKSGTLRVADLATATPGKMRFADVNIVTTRIRPVFEVAGLPDYPLGVYVITASPEFWSGTGREFEIELHDKSIVLAEDAFDETFVAPAGEPVLGIVKEIVESAGERIDVDGSDTTSLAEPHAWVVSEENTKLRIVNDLLKAIGYRALWVDGVGAFRATRDVEPDKRSVRYSTLTDEEGQRLLRELVDGEQSIYLPEWDRDRDTYRIPNKVRAITAGTGAEEAAVGVATNENPASDFSYQARGNKWRVRTIVVDAPDFSGETDPAAALEAFLDERARLALIAMTSGYATVSLQCLPIPVELLDVIVFGSTPAGINAKHSLQGVYLELRPTGLMSLDLEEVAAL